MAAQARAVRTRQAVLEAAAAVFDERGYEAASIAEILACGQISKGALYFHFPSKEALARGVIDAQMEGLEVSDSDSRLQAAVLLTLHVARRLQTDVLMRAAIRLTVEHGTFLDVNGNPYEAWINVMTGLLTEAKGRGELLPHADPNVLAQLIVGAFTGIQLLSQVLCGRRDLPERVVALWQHVLPGIATPGVVPHIRFE